MTDERMGDALWQALARLPRGSGVVFRHYGLAPAERRRMFVSVARVARARRLMLVRGGGNRLGRGEQGVHGRFDRHSAGLRTWPAHNAAEIGRGLRAKADLIFISPVFTTRSHPDAQPLGLYRAAMLARIARGRAIALGGVTRRNASRVTAAGFYGWAAIDGLTTG